MRKSFTAVIERNATFTSDFATEPYECAWASEARWFIRVLETESPATRLNARTQVSPDGLAWCDEGTEFPEVRAPGLYTITLRDFGGWLRLDCKVSGAEAGLKVFISLALKE